MITTSCNIGNKKKEKEEEPKRPNIVSIMTDDHTAQAISAYGHPFEPVGAHAVTPN
ncbi:hypothetical protein [Salinimicrobium sp. WS361]|uniref:hypothetical protein n=1 Tax=Salinimicrobium sp. WS361 TaxID=3425123 RepID=UPI003D6DEFB0